MGEREIREDRSRSGRDGRVVGLFAVAAAVLAFGCGDDPAGPGEEGEFSREITFEELESSAGESGDPLRVEISLPAGSSTASEVEVEDPEEDDGEEEIEGRLTAIPSADCAAGRLTLAVGAFELDVRFDGSTEFEAEGEDDAGDDEEEIACADFLARARAALDAGRTPRLEAERPAAVPAQAPDDPDFLATELELEDDGEEDDDGDELELNLDARHLSGGDVAGDGRIAALGIEIDVRAGETEIEAEDVAHVEFEGTVACGTVDVAAGSFALDDGTVVRVESGTTRIEADADEPEELDSLEALDAACAAGGEVEAEGEGVVTATSPDRVVVATELELEREDEDDGAEDDGEDEDAEDAEDDV